MKVVDALEEGNRRTDSFRFFDFTDRRLMAAMGIWLVMMAMLRLGLPHFFPCKGLGWESAALLGGLLMSVALREGIRLWHMKRLGCQDAHVRWDRSVMPRISSRYCMDKDARISSLMVPDSICLAVTIGILLLFPLARAVAFWCLALHGFSFLGDLAMMRHLRNMDDKMFTFAHEDQIDIYVQGTPRGRRYFPGKR